MVLAQPPPARLVIARPIAALLPDSTGAIFADTLAKALAAQDIPAISTESRPGDWRLVISAEMHDNQVVPMYTVFDASGEQAGVQQGQPVLASAWAAGSLPTMQAAATNAAPGISSLLTNIEAVRLANDPNSLVNRQAKLGVPDVKGAPGDGDHQLARQMRLKLVALGMLVQNTNADFTVAGQVMAVPVAGNQTRIEIQWVITDAAGAERGRIVQLNEVPAGTLNRFWGDVAVVVAQEAATGVKDIVARQIGSKPK